MARAGRITARQGPPSDEEMEARDEADAAVYRRRVRAMEKAQDKSYAPYDPEHHAKIYAAQEKGREKHRAKKLEDGGDEDLFRVIDAADIGEPEPVEIDKGGVTLSTGVHRISGPPGGGKTRLAYWIIIQRVRSGERWAIFDKEMGAARYKQTMFQLGATDEDLKRIDYMDTVGSITPNLIRHGRALIRVAGRHGCNGILFDSMTIFLGAAEISENDPQGVRDWTVSACSEIPCAIILDHTGFGDESRGRGTSDKGAGCDVDMYLKVIKPFAIGQDGQIMLGMNKDRSGTILSESTITIDVTCWPGGMDFQPDSWEGKSDRNSEASNVMVSECLTLLLMQEEFKGRDYAKAGELQKAVKGSKNVKLERIAAAVKDGSILEEGAGRSKRYFLPQ